jgi:hypothetical protein
MPPEWAKKFNSPTGPALTPLQERLIRLMTEGAKTKLEISSALFPGVSDAESIGRRVDQVILSIRKQLPGFVVFKDGKYHCVPGGRAAKKQRST